MHKTFLSHTFAGSHPKVTTFRLLSFCLWNIQQWGDVGGSGRKLVFVEVRGVPGEKTEANTIKVKNCYVENMWKLKDSDNVL